MGTVIWLQINTYKFTAPWKMDITESTYSHLQPHNINKNLFTVQKQVHSS